MTIRYIFKDGPVTIKAADKADPQKIGDALRKISAEHEGRLTPRAVIEAARNERSPLHRHFEWDDAVAAEAYRLDQAREIIRVVRVQDDDGAEPVRAFLSIADKDGTSYRSVSDVRQSADLQLAVLRQAERDLEAFERRYQDLTDICNMVRAARSALQKRRAKIETRAAA